MSGGGGGGERARPFARAAGTVAAVLALVVLAGLAVGKAGRLATSPQAGTGELDVRPAPDGPAASEPLAAPADGQWELLRHSGLEGRVDPVAVWTGREVFVWGGSAPRRGTRRVFADGALYDPVQRTWSPLRQGPPQAWQEGVTGVWTGTEILVVGGRNHVGRDPVAQAYDPDRGVWRRLPTPPRDAWLWRTATWTGSHLVVVRASEPGGTGGGTARYDPVADRWQRGGGISSMRLDGSSRAAWVDGQMVVTGTAPGSRRLVVQSFDPVGAAFRRGRGAPPATEWLADVAADEPRGDAVLAGPLPGHADRFAAARWSRRDGWRMLPDVPGPLRNGRPVRVFVTSAGPLLWPDGDAAPSVLSGNEWRPLPPAPMDKRSGEAVVWTGHGLFVWGGQGDGAYDSGALFRPAATPPAGTAPPEAGAADWAGGWRELPPLPAGLTGASLLAGPEGHVAVARGADGRRRVWRLSATGWDELADVGGEPDACVARSRGDVLVWGRDFDADAWSGRAVNVVDGADRALPPPPLPVHGMMACTAWGQDVALVSASGEGASAALFDAAAGRWTPLPPLPVVGLLTGLVTAGADAAAPLLLVTDLTVARLDPGGQWELFPTPRNGYAATEPAITWGGDRLLVWGGASLRPLRGGWSWNAGRNLWKQIPPAWITAPSGAPPHAWSGERWVVWGDPEPRREPGGAERPALAPAAYEPATGRWLRLPPTPADVAVVAALWDDGLVALAADGSVWRFFPAS